MRGSHTVLILVALGLATPSWAEEPPADAATIDVLLRAGSPKEVAWGAHLAGRELVREAVPELLRFLHPDPERIEQDPEWPLAYRAVLDALIRLEVAVPPALLGPGLPETLRGSTMTLILRAREPREHQDVLMAVFERSASTGRPIGMHALVAGNLLAARHAPGFAALVMPHIRTQLVVTVHDTDEFSLRGGHADFFAGRGDAIIRQPEGYPPYAMYELVLDESPGLPLVAAGPRAVHYRRTQREGVRFGRGSRVSRFRLEDLARPWIADMLEIEKDALGLPARSSHLHRWSTADAFVAWAVARRDALRKRHAEVVSALRKQGALTKEEAAALRPGVDIEIRDERRRDRTPLPVLPPPGDERRPE